MQYKISFIYALWRPKDSLTIRLWKEEVVGQTKLPTGVPNPISFCLIWGTDELKVGEKEKFISSMILTYIEFWKLGMSKDDSYVKVMGPYVKY